MRRLSDVVDPRPLAFARIGVGVVALLDIVEIRVTLHRVGTTGVPRPQWSWLPPLSEAGEVGWLSLVVLAAVALVLGVMHRVAGVVLALGLFAMFAWEQQTYSNHAMLCGWLALWLACSRADAVWSWPRAAGPAPTVRFGDQVLLMTQLSVCYLATALIKVDPGFLSGEVLATYLRVPVPGGLLPVLAVGAVTIELFVWWGLWWARTRRAAAVLGVLLHLSIPVMLHNPAPLVLFSALCLVLYPLFFAGAGAPVPQRGAASSRSSSTNPSEERTTRQEGSRSSA